MHLEFPVRARSASSGLLPLALLALALTGCQRDLQKSSHQHTRINGVVPPGQISAAQNIRLMGRAPAGDGWEMVVYRTTRQPGTRAPIHYHDHSGITCLISGESTLLIEGQPPRKHRAGECFVMPSGVPMANLNSGKQQTVTLDMFTIPAGGSVWRVAEPGQQAITSQFKQSEGS